ncbi:MAG: hypothetical protein NTX61_01685 [Bacteroidetes bacterium]|nr:hypothetical protein [Bacteroidota bacterium]
MKNAILLFILLFSFSGLTLAQDPAKSYERGIKKLNKQNYEGALQDFKDVLERSPIEYPEVYFYKSSLENQLKKYQEAYQTLKFFGIFVKDDDDLRALLFIQRGIAEYNLGEIENAINDYESADNLDYRDGSLYLNLGNAWLSWKNKKDRKATFEKSHEFYSKAIAFYKDSTRVLGLLYYKRCIARYYMQNYGSALADINKSLEIDSTNMEGLYTRSKIKVKKGLYWDAIKDYTRIINKTGSARAYVERGKTYLLLDKFLLARNDFNSAKNLDNGDFYYQALFYSGQKACALKHYQDLLNNTSVKDSLRTYSYYLSRFYASDVNPGLSSHYINIAAKSGFDLNEITTDDNFNHVKFKKAFLDSVKIELPRVTQSFLDQLHERELLEINQNQPEITASFIEPSGNGVLDGNERGYIMMTITNKGSGMADLMDINLVEINNSPGINYLKGNSLQCLKPGETQIFKFDLIAEKNIPKGKLNFVFYFIDPKNNAIKPLEIQVCTAPYLSIKNALTLNTDSIISLDLSDKGFRKLPSEILSFKNLEYLDLSKNKFRQFDTLLRYLPKLRKLDLSKNQIESLPDDLCKLTHLEILFADSNQIRNLPGNLDCLQQLKVFSISSNKIDSLNESITNCRSLETLDVSSNLITSIPGSLNRLNKLKILNINNNPISGIPVNFEDLKQLNTLNLSGIDKKLAENIIGIRIKMKNIKYFTYSEPFSNNEKIFSIPNESDYPILQNWWNDIQNNDYLACIHLGDYLQKTGHSELANVIYSKTLHVKNLDYQACLSIGHFFDERMLNELADSMYLRTLKFDKIDYVQRMKIADELFQHKRFDISALHYNRVVYDNSFTSDTAIYELARFFEERAFFDLSILMYRKISENPQYAGSAKALLASLSIADLYQRHPEFENKTPVYDLYNSIAYTNPSGYEAAQVVISACKKCWSLLDKQSKKLTSKFDQNKNKMIRLARQQQAAENVSSFGGFITSIASQYVPDPTGGLLAGTATQLGGDLYALNRNNNYQNLNRINQQIDQDISEKKQTQAELTQRINIVNRQNFSPTPNVSPDTDHSTAVVGDGIQANPVTPASKSINEDDELMAVVNTSRNPYQVLDEYFSNHEYRSELNDSILRKINCDTYSPMKIYTKLKYKHTTLSNNNKREYYNINVLTKETKNYNDRVYYRMYTYYSDTAFQRNQKERESWLYNDSLIYSNLIIDKNGTHANTNPIKHYTAGETWQDTTKNSRTITMNEYMVLSLDTSVTVNHKLYQHAMVIKTISKTNNLTKDMKKFDFTVNSVSYYARYIGFLYYKSETVPVVNSEMSQILNSTSETILINYDIRK